MADTSFVSKVTNIVLAWAQAVNDYLYKGRNPNFATTTGSANAQVLTLSAGSLYTIESDGDFFSFKAGFSNTLAMTLQVLPPGGTNAAGAVQFNGSTLTGGEIVAGQNYTVTRLGATWQLSASGVAIGRNTVDTLTNKTIGGSTNTIGGAQAQNVPVAAIGFVFDGGGAALTTGVKGDLLIPFACTINSVTLQADQSGSIVIDIWKKAYTVSSPPTVANTITASALPTLSTAQSAQDITLTGWTTAISANDMLRFNINSVTTCQRVTLILKVTKT